MATRQPLRSTNENTSMLPKPSGLPQPSGLPKPKSGLPKPSGLARPTTTTAAPTNAKPPVQKRKLQQPSTNVSSQPAKKSRLNSSTSESGAIARPSLMRKSSSTSSLNRVGVSNTMNHPGARPVARAGAGTAVNRAAVNKTQPAAKKAQPAGSKPPAATNGKRPAWDLKGRMADMEAAMNQLKNKNNDLQGQVSYTDETKAALEEQTMNLKQRVQNLTADLESKNETNQRLRNQLNELETSSREETRRLRNEVEDITQEKSSLERKVKNLEADLDVSRQEGTNLRMTVNAMTAAQSTIKAELDALKMTLEQSQKDNREKTELISRMMSQIANLEAEIRDHEMNRRKLHNTIQELKGNIRVFCRVRPLLGDEALGYDDVVPPHISFPDPKESKMIELDKVAGDMTLNESSIMANKKGSKYAFTFDKVFTPTADQSTVFEEISQLVQSSLDGYNVCIFAYGQTGSGKTFTMEGYDENLGMIPRAVHQVFQTAQELQCKGWEYEFEASFLEIYNDTIRDLLSKKDNQKHEIKKVPNSQEVCVTNLTYTKVTEQSQVHNLLDTAAENRAVAETKCNARSSRSHSVFRLRITGNNTITHDKCVSTLNLVDLAGSERLKDSGSEGDRLKETKAINKSLAELGNVIMALANKDPHVPYRNCKLTYLLQNSLGGNSKCLMFVNVAPKEECFNETLNTLRFATKVNNCNIGTAQRVTK